MNGLRIMAAAAALSIFWACGGPAGPPSGGRKPGALMRTVTSDAIVAMDYDRLGDLLGVMLDSTSALRRIDYGKLAGSEAVLSYVYTGSVEPVLAIDAGKASGDTTAAVASVLRQADSLGLQCRYFPTGWEEGAGAALFLFRAKASVPSMLRHLSSGSSIYNAPRFSEAIQAAGHGKGTIYIRGGAAPRIIPRSLAEGIIPRGALTSFLSKCADWAVFTQNGDGSFTVNAAGGEAPGHYPAIFDALETGESRIWEVMPRSAGMAVSECITPGFREAYEAWRDASSNLDQYGRRISSLKKEAGKSPLDWEKETGVKEVAFVSLPEGPVTAVRTSRRKDFADPVENPWQGFAGALYGSLFGAADPLMAAKGEWLLFGDWAALKAFLEAEDFLPQENWPAKNCHFTVYRPGLSIVKGARGTVMNVCKTD